MSDKRKVLLVDDSRSIRTWICHGLSAEYGIEVLAAETFAQAKEIVGSSVEEHIVVALLDLNLPDAPNGEAVEWVLKELGIPVIVLTATYSGDLISRLRVSGVLDIVLKRNPLEIENLFASVHRLFENFHRTAMVVDDSASTREMICKLLSRVNLGVMSARDAQDALAQLDESNPPTLIVTDFNMPGLSGDEFVSRLRMRFSRTEMAIIGISMIDSPETAVKLLKAGANDFINRPFFEEEFYCRVSNALEMVDNFQRLQDASLKDFLTQLNNRLYLFQFGQPIWEKAGVSGSPLSLAMMDIDHFKSVNDTHGHAIGDRALKHVARVLRRELPQATAICRMGGEEFCVLADGVSLETMLLDMEHFRAALEAEPIRLDALDLRITVSIGVTDATLGSLDEMIDDADKALYRAKENGRNRVEHGNTPL